MSYERVRVLWGTRTHCAEDLPSVSLSSWLSPIWMSSVGVSDTLGKSHTKFIYVYTHRLPQSFKSLPSAGSFDHHQSKKTYHMLNVEIAYRTKDFERCDWKGRRELAARNVSSWQIIIKPSHIRFVWWFAISVIIANDGDEDDDDDDDVVKWHAAIRGDLGKGQ